MRAPDRHAEARFLSYVNADRVVVDWQGNEPAIMVTGGYYLLMMWTIKPGACKARKT
jgi:hypothetical protein